MVSQGGLLHDCVEEGVPQSWRSFHLANEKVAVSGISWEKWNYLTRKCAVVVLGEWKDLFLGPNSLLFSLPPNSPS